MALCLFWAWRAHAYVGVWESDLTLWHHAVQEAPLKLRPRLNYAAALILADRLTEARIHLEYADRLTALPHVPRWDRGEARRVIDQNRLVLMGLEGR